MNGQDEAGKTRVLMCFNRTRGTEVWNVFFRVPPKPKPLPREMKFSDPDKLRSLYERFGMRRALEDKQAFEHAISTGGGIVSLLLGPEQIAKLQ